MLFPFTSKFLYSNSSIWSSLNKKQLFLDKVTYMNSKWGVKQRSINEAAMWVGASRFGSLVMWSHIRMKMFVSLDILTEDTLAAILFRRAALSQGNSNVQDRQRGDFWSWAIHNKNNNSSRAQWPSGLNAWFPLMYSNERVGSNPGWAMLTSTSKVSD